MPVADQNRSSSNPESNPESNPRSVEESVEVGDLVDVTLDRVATGGAAIGPDPGGRLVFVTGAIPGERVSAKVSKVHRNRLEAAVGPGPGDGTVVEASDDRVPAPCSHVSQQCGGCDWQHITPARQSELRRAVVEDCLRRLGKFEDVDIRPGPALAVDGYRTTVRAAVVDGRAAYRQAASHDTVIIEECLTAHPLVEEILREGRFGSASEVTVRAGANTGERLVLVSPSAEGVSVPDGVTVVGADELAAGANPHYHENIGGLRLQISARSFFQCRADGALALAQLVGDALAEVEGPMLDAYCGVGLFGAVAGVGRQVIGVESASTAVGDARWNLRPHGQVVEARFEKWDSVSASVAVADPARSGLRAQGCDRLAATGAELIALVSCDPASLARDASLLEERGYGLDYVTVLDLFGHTSHIETVARFVRQN